MSAPRIVHPPTGTKLSCRNWLIEAPYRMIQHNLSPDVAEIPEELIVYGGSGKAARNWECFDAILKALRELEPDETLCVQSGKPVGIFRTHPDAPRVLIANSNLVPHWATAEVFNELEEKGLIMYGQMTAGSWIYIGTQGILQGTYETLAECARQNFGGSLKGKIVLTAGLGGMGGAQPLAVTMNEGVALVVEVDKSRIEKRLRTKYLMETTEDIIDAVDKCRKAAEEGRAYSIGLLGNAADTHQALLEMGFIPDVLTDQTSAHDALKGYVPHGIEFEDALRLRKDDPQEYIEMAYESIAVHLRAMLAMRKAGAITFDYGNNIRGQALKAGVEDAFTFPGFVPAYIRPLFCKGKGPFRWVALSGDARDIYRTDELVVQLFPDDEPLRRWIRKAHDEVQFQGLPSRICWLGLGERARFGLALNELVANGQLSAPIVIGRDHLDCGSVASPNRETEGMLDGSDAIADWPLLNALLNTASGATWVSIHHGGGVGIGYSIHAGQVIVADGTKEAARRLERVLTNDPAIGVVRHADAGYEEARRMAKERGVNIPKVD